ncbi:MAG: ASCH domain-containing protein [Phycisphaerae bacterium]|nr:ASCH domain-containing protein [Phycisphaerae bacterium]
MLMMKKMFFDAIRRGEKTTTLRYWQRQHINSGSVEFVRGLGRLRIDGVRSVNFNELTDDDAQLDGFSSLDELDKTLDEIYTPEQRYSRELFLVQFTFLNDDDMTWVKKTG